MTITDQNQKAKELKNELKDFFYVEKGDTVIKVELSERQGLLIPNIDFHHRNEKNRLRDRMMLFGFPKITESGDTRATFGSITTCCPVEAGREPAIMKGEFLSAIDLQPIREVLNKWIDEKGNKHRVCIGSNGKFLRVQTVPFAKNALTYLETRFGNQFEFHRLGEDIFVLSGKNGHTAPGPTADIHPDENFFETVIRDVFKMNVSQTMVNGDDVIVGLDSAETAEKLKPICDEYFFATAGECRWNNQTLIFDRRKKYNSIDEIKEAYILMASTASGASNDSTSTSNGLPQDIISEIVLIARDSPVTTIKRSEMNIAIGLIAKIGVHFGLKDYKVGNTLDKLSFPGGRTIRWPEQNITGIAQQFTALGYDVVPKRISLFFRSVFPKKTVTSDVSIEVKEISKVVAQKPVETSSDEGLIFEIPVRITSDHLPLLLSNLSMEKLLEEAKKKGFEELMPIDSISNNDLIVEIKRRGKEFIRQLMDQILG